VRADVADGLVSVEQAQSVYGIEMQPRRNNE